MKELANKNVNTVLLTVQQVSELTNLGSTTVRKLALESGAGRKIGKSYRINKQKFLEYIELVCIE